MKARRARFLTEGDRDREAYALARAYLLDHGSEGITDELVAALHQPSAPRPYTDHDGSGI